MLSRKLLGSVAVGVLSVALVPATWARTHSLLAHRPTTQTSKVVSKSPKSHPMTITAPKTVSKVSVRKVISKKPLMHKLSSRRVVSHKLVSHKLTAHKLVSHRTVQSKTGAKNLVSHKTTSSKLATKRPVNSKLVKKPIAN